jgi:hypothetical protein
MLRNRSPISATSEGSSFFVLELRTLSPVTMNDLPSPDQIGSAEFRPKWIGFR